MILSYFAYKLSSCYTSFCHVQFYLQRSNYTVPLSKLKKTDPKAQQLGVCQGTLRSNRTATRHRPVTRTANAADAPSFVQNVWPDHEVCLGLDGLRNKWNRMSTAKLFGNVWHGSHWDVHPPFGLKVVSLNAPFQAKCLQNHCESDSSQPLGLGET